MCKNMNKPMPVSSAIPLEEIDYLERRFLQGADDEVIATEMQHYGRRVPWTVEEVAAHRADKNLPKPDSLRVIRSMTISPPQKDFAEVVRPKRIEIPESKGEALTRKDRPLSATSAGVPLKRTKQLRGSKRELFENAVSIDTQDQAPVEKIKIDFTPQLMTKFKKDGVYIYPSIGPVTFKGVENTALSNGMNPSTYIFEEIYIQASNKRALRVPVSQIQTKNIRLPADATIMKNIASMLQQGLGRMKGLSPVGAKHEPVYLKYHNSENIVEVANLVCHSFAKKRANLEFSAMDQRYARDALHMITAEYAVALKIGYAEAKDNLEQKLNTPLPKRPTAKSLGPSPA
jgi:RNA polymerase-interacting CarD/CdnL/TRCF family regulator